MQRQTFGSRADSRGFIACRWMRGRLLLVADSVSLSRGNGLAASDMVLHWCLVEHFDWIQLLRSRVCKARFATKRYLRLGNGIYLSVAVIERIYQKHSSRMTVKTLSKGMIATLTMMNTLADIMST